MSPDELRDRFLAEIDARGRDDKYIDGVEERELMQIGIQHGFPPADARKFLTDACRQRGYVVEAAVVELVRGRLAAGGRIDRRGFERLVTEAAAVLRPTTRTDKDVRRLVVTTLDDAGPRRVKVGWFGNWYARLKRELGV